MARGLLLVGPWSKRPITPPSIAETIEACTRAQRPRIKDPKAARETAGALMGKLNRIRQDVLHHGRTLLPPLP